MATPIDDASRRWASRVEFSATTAKTTSPGLRYFTPSLRASSLQLGGKMEETRTRFWAAMPASRNASSNEVSRSRCFPTPLVKKMRLGTMSLPNAFVLRQRNFEMGNAQSNITVCKHRMNFAAHAKKSGNRTKFVPAGTLEDGALKYDRGKTASGSGYHRGHVDGVVFFGARDFHFGSGLLVESG